MQNQNIETAPKFGNAARHALLTLIYSIDEELKHVPANGTALERALWDTMAARVAEVEKLTGPLQLVASLGLQFFRGQVRMHLLRLEGFGTTYQRQVMLAHAHLQPAFWWGLERCGRFFKGKDEWSGNLYEMLNLLNDPTNALTDEERSKVNISPLFVNTLLGAALHDLPGGLVTGSRPAGVDFTAVDARWIWTIKHSAVTAATV